MTLNPVLQLDQYPLPKPIATLAWVDKFSVLDLSKAYHQFLIDEQSQLYVTINTHRGLYRYKRRPYGVASSPVTFQKVMDTILQGLHATYIHDLLIISADDSEHLSNLEVLQRSRE